MLNMASFYQCKHCEALITSGNTPNAAGCPKSTFHLWTKIGNVGGSNYLCKHCGVLVQTNNTPNATGCPKSTFHSWTKLGNAGSNTFQEKRYEEKQNRESTYKNDNYKEKDRASYSSKRAASVPMRSSYSSGSSSENNKGGGIGNILGFLAILPFIIGFIVGVTDITKVIFPGIKVNFVSGSCYTEEEYLSILVKKGFSGVETVIEGEGFTTYSQQALDAIKGKYSKYRTYKDSVYFVRLPDGVNVYVWFETEDKTTAYVYKTE